MAVPKRKVSRAVKLGRVVNKSGALLNEVIKVQPSCVLSPVFINKLKKSDVLNKVTGSKYKNLKSIFTYSRFMLKSFTFFKLFKPVTI